MRITRWILAFPLAMTMAVGTVEASSVKDGARLFGADAIRQANAELSRIEREESIATTVETVDSLDGATVGQKTREHAQRSGTEGIYVLIAKNESKIDVISSSAFRNSMNPSRLRTIENAFIAGLKARDFDGAILGGVKAIDSEASSARAQLGTLRQGGGAVRVGRNGRVGNRGGSFGLSSLLGIGLLVFGGLFILRLLGSLFRGGGMQNAYGPGRMGGPGGVGPGYGGGGGGGGFMSSMFGGIGGALAGNWLYDQFSGRHHGGNYNDSSTYGDAADPATGAADWSNGGDAGGADWGGGGGDAGGGGDWGGGGGGGDWGGGGDGGSW